MSQEMLNSRRGDIIMRYFKVDFIATFNNMMYSKHVLGTSRRKKNEEEEEEEEGKTNIRSD